MFADKTPRSLVGKGSVNHNSRKFKAANVDGERTDRNIDYCSENIKDVYHELFDDALERYNAKQTRDDRRIENYYEKIRSGKQEKPFHELILQIGDNESWFCCRSHFAIVNDWLLVFADKTPRSSANMGANTENGELAKQILDEYYQGFQERNPSLRVFSAHLHMDEATPHLHIDYIPIGHFSKGLDTKNAMAKALEEMGYGSGKDAINRWRMSEREVLNKICQAHGIEISESQKSRGYSFKVQEYGEYKDEIRALESQKEQISGEFEKAVRKKVNVDEIERIEVKKSAFGKSVTVSQADFDILSDAAKKYVALEKSTKRLKEENAHLKSKASSLEKENLALKAEVGRYKSKDENSIIATLRKSQKEAELERIRNDLAAAVQVIDRNGLRSEFEAAKKLKRNEKNHGSDLTKTV